MNNTLKDVLARSTTAQDTIDISKAIHLNNASVHLSENKDYITIKGINSAGKREQVGFHLTKIDDLIEEADRESSPLLGDLYAIKGQMVNDHGVWKIRNDGPKLR